MKIIPPITITDSVLISTSVPEPDASMGEIVWQSGTAYTKGQIRIRTQTHRKYEAITNHTSTIPPEQDFLNWVDAGPTNRYAVFDVERNTSSVVNSTALTFTVRPVVKTQALCLFGISGGQTISVVVRSGSTNQPIYSRQMSLTSRNVTNWFEYFFTPFSFRESAVFVDLPLQRDVFIDVSVARENAGLISVQTAVFGVPIDIGDAEYGITSDIQDFSRIERNEFGDARLIKRKNIPTLNAQIFCPKSKVPEVRRLREKFQASPLVFLTISDTGDAYFESLAMLGIFKRMPIAVEYPNHVLINLEAEGL